MESGGNEEESNMATLTPVGKSIDQDQNKREEVESDGLATQEAKELAAQLVEQHTGGSNTKHYIDAVKARRALGVENSEEHDGTCGQEEVVSLQAGHVSGYCAVKSEAGNPRCEVLEK